MTDKEKLDCALCNIISTSDTCAKCTFRHCSETDHVSFCFFAVDCICNDHKDYKKEANEE